MFVKPALDFVADFILGAQIQCCQNQYTDV